MTNNNRPKEIPVITITAIEVSEWECTYKLFHDKSGRTYTFEGLNQTDRWCLSKITAGKSYEVIQAVSSQRNRTHWVGVTEYFESNGRTSMDPILMKTSQSKAVLTSRLDKDSTVEF